MVVGAGAAGVYGAIRAKTLAPNLTVVVVEKARPLAKVCFSQLVSCVPNHSSVINPSILDR